LLSQNPNFSDLLDKVSASRFDALEGHPGIFLWDSFWWLCPSSGDDLQGRSEEKMAVTGMSIEWRTLIGDCFVSVILESAKVG